MKILALSSTFPYPPSRGGTEVRTYHLLAHLAAQGHQVTIATQRHGGVTDAEVAALADRVGEVVLFPLPADPPRGRSLRFLPSKAKRLAQSWLKQTPSNVLKRYSPELQAWLDRQVAAGQVDALTCEHSVNEIYVRPEWKTQIRTVVDVHSSIYGWTKGHLDMGAAQNPWRDRLNLPLLANYERRYAAKFGAIVTTTTDDRDQMAQFAPQAEHHVIPNGVDLDLFPCRDRSPEGADLVFVGAMDASHNIDAALFFAQEVLPQLRAKNPTIRFRIAGARPAPEIQALANQPGIVVTGPVDSMAAELHRSALCVVPLRTGLGIKNKTLEAMAAGCPVVGSDRGLEGLAIEPRPGQPERALRANTPAEYVEAIIPLLADPARCDRLTQAARQYVETEFTWASAGDRYAAVLEHRQPRSAG